MSALHERWKCSRTGSEADQSVTLVSVRCGGWHPARRGAGLPSPAEKAPRRQRGAAILAAGSRGFAGAGERVVNRVSSLVRVAVLSGL